MAEPVAALERLSTWERKQKDEDRFSRAIKLIEVAGDNADLGETTKEGKKAVKLRFADEEAVLEEETAEPLSPKRVNSVSRRDRVGRKRPGAMAFDYLDIATLSEPTHTTTTSPSSAEDRKKRLQSMKGISAAFYQHSSRAPKAIEISEWLNMAKGGNGDGVKPIALKPRKIGGTKFKRTFLVPDLIDWLIATEVVQTREQGLLKASSALKAEALEILPEGVSVLSDSEELACRWADDDSKPRPQTARPILSPDGHRKGSGPGIITKSSLMKSMMRKEKKEMTLFIAATGEVGIIRARKEEEPMLEICINDEDPLATAGEGELGGGAPSHSLKLSLIDLTEKLYLIDLEVERAKEKKEAQAALLSQSQPGKLEILTGSESGSDIKSEKELVKSSQDSVDDAKKINGGSSARERKGSAREKRKGSGLERRRGSGHKEGRRNECKGDSPDDHGEEDDWGGPA